MKGQSEANRGCPGSGWAMLAVKGGLIAAFALRWWAGTPTLQAQAAGPATAPSWISRAIAELGDDAADVREAAQRKLWAAGKAAEPALEAALTDADPEVAARVREILIEFKYGLTPETPLGIQNLIRQYRRGDLNQKQSVVQTLLRMGQVAYPYLVKLSSAEPNQNIRSQIFRELARRGQQGIAAFISEGQFAQAEQLLEMTMADGSSPAVRNYAAYVTLMGRGEQKIAELKRQLDLVGKAPAAAQTLAFLYRAKGDLKSALAAAKRSGDPELIGAILFELGDWKSLGDLQRSEPELTDIERLGFLAAYQRLCGDRQAFSRTLESIRRINHEPTLKPLYIAKALLLNDQVDEGISVLLDSGDAAGAFDLLVLRQDFQKAIKVAQGAIAAKTGDALSLRATLGRLHYYLGQREQATEMFDKLAAELKQGGDPVAYVQLVGAEAQCRLVDRAEEHAAEAMAQARMEDNLGVVLQSLFPEREPSDYAIWYRALREMRPDESSRQIIARLREMHQRRISPAQLQKLAEAASGVAMKMDRMARELSMRAIGRRLMEAECYAAAEATFARLAELTRVPQDYVGAGNAALRLKQFRKAAEMYESAQQRDRAMAAAAYLRGYALQQAGDQKEGEKLMRAAVLLPLADESQRFAFPMALREAGLDKEADEQEALVLRTGQFLSWELGNAVRRAAIQAMRSGDELAASVYLERANLECLSLRISFRQVGSYLTSPFAAHRARAVGLVKTGRFDEALAEAQACMNILPGSTEVAIDLYPLLIKASRQQDADRLLNQSLEVHEKLMSQYPQAATFCNSVAWLLARCHRDLDKALAAAKKGVELEPKNTAVIDTLAEVYFQLGQKDKAIEMTQRCIELEPDAPRHKSALKRIEQGNPDVPPPPE